MADIKTHLRELGVVAGLYLLMREEEINIDKLKPKEFFNICLKSLESQDLKLTKISVASGNFSELEKKIIKNSSELAKAIFTSFKLNKNDKIKWCGGNTQKDDPIDLIVGKYSFSLKEESFILENMGLYKYLNLMTGIQFDRGTHIFEKFAPEVYNNFFNFVWNSFIKERKDFFYTGGSYESSAIFLKNFVKFTCNKGGVESISVLPLDSQLSIMQFDKLTNSTTRETVFSKWIKENLEKKVGYLTIKKSVSELAASNLVVYVKNNFDSSHAGLKRFLRLHDKVYYYAKSTQRSVEIYKVPSSNDFNQVFVVEDISYVVPESQINIYTRIKNKINGEVLILRNELRFSHGQFNGTPEAKMYYSRGGNLETIYVKVF